MRRRQTHRPLPSRWLMTDERLGDALWEALERLPRGGGVVFRHYATDGAERRALFARVMRIARRRGLTLIHAGPRRGTGADGFHNARGPGLRTMSVHSVADALAARRCGADLIFVSPVFATRSHPAAAPLGPHRAARLRRIAGVPAIALGGMNEARFTPLRGRGFHGWAGIDAWNAPQASGQKRNAVPI